jgi:hypothetical protein
MRLIPLLFLILAILSCSTGCVSKNYNPGITVTSPDITDMAVTNVGNFDLYAAEFQIENPTNRTLKNVQVQINLVPALAYCHPLTKTIEIPVFNPLEKKSEEVSIAEFSELGCQYSYTWSAVAER